MDEAGHVCFTDVYEDGRIHRGCGINENGVNCVQHKFPHTTQCFCDGELCNNGHCLECFGTTSPPVDTTPTPEGTTLPPATTPAMGITCYDCQNS